MSAPLPAKGPSALYHLTPFWGRERELRLLRKDLEERVRMITITGPSGMGKTRLARQVMAQVHEDYRDEGGVWFCSLAGAQSASELEVVIAQALGIQLPQGEALGRILAERGRILLVLDNLDPIARSAAPFLESWLHEAEELQLLCTSILPVGSFAEVRFELGSLELEDAIRLYESGVHRVWADREAPPEEGEVVEELVRKLDRVPLAIELAAARVHVFPPRALLSRLSERFHILRSERPGRHGSLSRAIAWTWEFLGKEERVALERAAIFVGGFSLESAEALLGNSGDPAEVWELLDELRGRSLIQVEEGDQLRYSLYESIREFACAQRRADDETRATDIARHAAYFLEEAERQAKGLEGQDAIASARWLATERENLLAAHRNTLDTDPHVAARIGLALSPVLAMQGPPSSELTFLDAVVAAAQHSERLTLRALRNRAEARIRHGAFDEAERDLDRVEAIAQRLGDEVEEGFGTLIRLHSSIDHERLESLHEGIERARIVGKVQNDPKLEGMASMKLGHLHDLSGSPVEAKEWFETALRIFRAHDLLRLQGLASMNLAVGWRRLGQVREARKYQQQARMIFQRLGDRANEAYLLFNQGGFDLCSGLLEEAKEHTLEALGSDLGTGHLGYRALGLGNLGLIHLLEGQYPEGERCLGEAVLCYEEIPDKRTRALSVAFLGVAAALRGRELEARECLDEARAMLSGDEGNWTSAALDTLEGVFECAKAGLATEETEAAEALIASARLRLRRAPAPPNGVGFGQTIAIQLLRDVLRRQEERRRSDEPSAQSSLSAPIRMPLDGSWFEVGQERTELRRRPTLCSLLATLLEHHLSEPGVGLAPEELFHRAWKGEVALPASALQRVYTGVWALRSMGAPIVLAGKDKGYMLDPHREILLID